jgi:hypothetical protein
MRNALVVIQLALAVALLVGAGLLTHSFWRLQRQDPGFDSDNLISINVNLSRDRYRETGADPTVPGSTARSSARIAGRAIGRLDQRLAVFVRQLDESLLHRRARGPWRDSIGVLAVGRRRPVPHARNHAAARSQFSGERRRARRARRHHRRRPGGGNSAIAIPSGQRTPRAVSKVSTGARSSAWSRASSVIACRRAWARDRHWPSRQATPRIFRIAIRSDIDVAAMAGPLRAEVAQIDPEQPIWDVSTMRERIDRSLDAQRTPMLLVLLFGAVAFALSGVGIYGVLAFAVAQRTGEIGVRMSLGASPAHILRMVMIDGGRLVAMGVVLGGALALALGQHLRAQLFGVDVVDPASLAVVLALVAAIALTASTIPALRAARTSPLEALRDE